MESQEQSIPLIATTAALGAVLLLIFLVFNAFKGNKPAKGSKGNKDHENSNKGRKTNDGKKAPAKKSNPSVKKVKKEAPFVPFSHPWLAGTLKGHSDSVTSFDFSSNGKYLVSASEDRVVMLWSVKEFCQKEKKYIRANVSYDCVKHVSFSPDSRAFLGSLDKESAVRVFKMAKKEDGSSGMAIAEGQSFDVSHEEMIAMAVSSNGRFIMTAGADTTIHLWTAKGEPLATINTNQMKNSCCKISPCGRFLGSSGFTPDVKVWEVCCDKSEAFKEVKRAFELKGHKAGVNSFDFNIDSSRMASVSKDGTWKIWNTDVNYQMGQDPKLLFSCSITLPDPRHIALSPDGLTVAVASDANISLYMADASSADAVLENVHSEPITMLTFDNLNRYVVSSGGRHINVIHNVTGYRAAVKDLEEKARTAKNATTSERLKKQAQEKKDALNDILNPREDTTKSQ